MNDCGWIKLYRSIQKHWIWDNSDYLKWWIDILMEVNHDETKVLIKNELYICNRGQSVRSVLNWARRWRVDRGKAQRFLMLLEKDQMMTLKSDSRTSILTVCNYDSYQDARTTNAYPNTTTDEQHMNINKKDKKDKNISIHTWKTDFEIYLADCKAAFKTLYEDQDFLNELEHYYPKLDLKKSIEKSFRGYWGTETGWRNKKKDKSVQTLNWKTTLINNLGKSAVYKDKQ
jgi:hypothetical protein